MWRRSCEILCTSNGVGAVTAIMCRREPEVKGVGVSLE